MEKLLLIGASGFLGRKLLPSLSSQYEVVGTAYSRIHSEENQASMTLDITNPKQVRDVIEQVNPSIIILAAALADMDRCETERGLAVKINVTGVENVVHCCQNRVLVYYSSDAVFDGVRGDYREDDATNPINFYGETKLRGEQAVRSLPNHLILRICLMYSDQPDSPKFIPWLIRNLAQGKKVNVAHDFTINPTFIDEVASTTLSLLQKKCRGVYHVAGASAWSCYDIALYLARKWGFDTSLIHPVSRRELPWKAARAEKGTLNIDKLTAEGIAMSTFEEGMQKLWERMKITNAR